MGDSEMQSEEFHSCKVFLHV